MDVEYHLTVNDLELKETEKFIKTCENLGVKPVLIILERGNYVNQPMCTGFVTCETIAEADQEINKVVEQCREKGFEVIRKKVEISPEEDQYFHELRAKGARPYFEWHGKIEIEVEQIPKVKELIRDLGGHISRNSLNKNRKARFITIRDYESKDRYYDRVEKIKSILQDNKYTLIDENFELCIYDSREELDSGWIS